LEDVTIKKAIAEFSRLIASAASVAQAGPNSSAFDNWHNDALAILSVTPGDKDHRVAAFREIAFGTSPRLLAKVQKKAPTVIHKRKTLSVPTDRAVARHFQNAITEGVGILRSAKATLEEQ
jgi:hypothetical protein